MKEIMTMLVLMVMATAINAQTGEWTNDKYHTRIGFEVKHNGISFVSGHFNDFDIKVDAAGKDFLAIKVDVTVQTKSIDTGIEARDNHLRTADFFETDKYPTMTFRSTKFTKTGKNSGKIHGILTLRGISKPVVLTGNVIGKKIDPKTQKTIAGFRLRGSVKRSDFGLGPKFLPDAIGNEVAIIVDAEFASTK